jgi:hypothetical protein
MSPFNPFSWFKKLFSPRVAKRIAGRAFEDFRKLSPAELLKIGRSPKSERYVEIERGARLTKKTPTISKRQFRTKETGLTPERLAKAHRAGERAYKARPGSTPAATEAQARAQSETRARFRRHPEFRLVEHEHTFIDQTGRWRSELFRGRDLAIMQEYRKDWKLALRINDASLLKRYKKMIIRNTDGVQVFPATDLDTIRRFHDRLSPRMRARFEREVFYLTKRDALAA